MQCCLFAALRCDADHAVMMFVIHTVYGVSASIIYSSCMRSSSTASSMPMWRTSTMHDPIKASSSRYPNRKLDPCQQIEMIARSSASRCWVGYITTTAEVHKFSQGRRGDDLRRTQPLRKVFHACRFPCERKHTRERCASSGVELLPQRARMFLPSLTQRPCRRQSTRLLKRLTSKISGG